MTRIDIFSGFLGAGKTTLIKKLIKEAYSGEKLVLIENEFGEIGIDGGFLKDSGINITEMNSGCICCSLVGDFAASLSEVINKFSPDRILIESSGVGKLSDVIKAVEGLKNPDIILNSAVAVADAKKCKMYMKNFGEFYNNQIEHAHTVVLSRTDTMSEDAVKNVLALIRDRNKHASIITTPWDKISGEQILSAMEKADTLDTELEHLHKEHCECGHHHHHHDRSECEHEHHHHHADEVFNSIGFETISKYSAEEISLILDELNNNDKYGNVLRAKGYLAKAEGDKWLYFDFVPEEKNLRDGEPEVIGRICVIGSNINKNALKELFRV